MKVLSRALLLLCLLAAAHPSLQAADPDKLRSEISALQDNLEKVARWIDASRKVASSHPAESVEFGKAALSLSKQLDSELGRARAHSNLGLIYINQQKFNLARSELVEAVSLKEKLIKKNPSYKSSLAKDYRLLGFTEERKDNPKLALNYYKKGVKYALEGRSREELAQGYKSVGEVQIKLKNYTGAIGALSQSLKLAQQLNQRKMARELEQDLATTYALLDNYMAKQEIEMEIETFQAEIEEIQDSLEKEQEVNQILVSEKELLEMDREKKEAELKAIEAENEAIAAEREAERQRVKAEQERYMLIGIGVGVVLLIIILSLVSRSQARKRANKALQAEKHRREELLYNIMPVEVAQELITRDQVKPRKYDQVSILFTDFKGFTSIAAKLSPEKLIAELNFVFQQFDQIIEKYGLEKIKTIGDAYMAAGGLPVPHPDHALDTVAAGLEMQAFMRAWGAKKVARGETPWELRVGINTGPVVAGVIGIKKFAYDIWGDAVNLASRMESHSEAGRVNISESTYQLVHRHCRCEARGKLPVKNKGEVNMYFARQMLAKKVLKSKSSEKPKKKPWWRR